jgi:DNA invertase Pin-like site-specific DNA recombinase
MKKSVIFARVSSVTDRQNTERQVLDLKQYAESNKFSVEAVFEEKISGGKKNLERPVLNDCLQNSKVNSCIMSIMSPDFRTAS